jgi:hypothetical protein
MLAAAFYLKIRERVAGDYARKNNMKTLNKYALLYRATV